MAAYVPVFTALIIAVFGLIGQVYIAKSTSNKRDAVVDVKLENIDKNVANLDKKVDTKVDRLENRVNEKIDVLQEKVEKHNCFMERIAVLENKDKNIIEILKDIKETCKDNRKSCKTIIRNQEE